MSFQLGRRANQWNLIGTTDRTAAKKVRHAHTERLCCGLVAELDHSELRVLIGIQARTLRFNKFAEAITLTEFTTGLRDVGGDLILDGDDHPYFAGCNIAKTETVSKALTRLEERELITRWRVRHRLAPVYMPFSEEWLASKLVDAESAIAPDYEHILENEYFSLGDRGRFRALETSGDRIVLEPVSDRLGYRDGNAIAVRREEWAKSGLRRLTVQEILAARRHRGPQ
jgi:hypothetical protein